MMKKIKNNKGVTLVSLAIAVAIIMILTNVIVYNAIDGLRANKLANLQTDIENLRDKVSNYYAQNGAIPADTSIEYTNIGNLSSVIGATDTGKFYVIDLAAMENVTLNYGRDYEKIRNKEVTTQSEINNLTDLYIINFDSHNVFYVAGIEVDGEMYYTDYTEDDKDTVPVTLYETNLVTAKDIPASDYGNEVNGYECTNNGAVSKWKLFYADENNVYLIAETCISYSDIPSNANGNKPYEENIGICADFTSVSADYVGSPDITKQELKDLNSSFYNKNYVNTYDSMKSVAYMMDTDAWKVFAGNKAEYAIGGPSLELFFKSYNKKYGTNYVAEATSEMGYQVGDGSSLGYSLQLSKPNDSLYVDLKYGSSYGYWIASPDAAYGDRGVSCVRGRKCKRNRL